MAKTQGAIALATGLNGLMGMKDTFVNLGGQVKNMIPILRSFSSAMIGALTGGIAIAITLIIAYWKDLKELVTGTTEAVKLSNEEIIASTKKGHDEFKKAANERTAILEREAKLKYDGQRLDEELAKIDRQRKIDEAVASGKLASEKKLIEEEYNKAIIDIREKYAKIEADKLKAKKEKEDKEAKKKQSEAKSDFEFYENLSKQEEKKKLAREKEYQQQALDSRAEFARQTLENQEDLAKEEEKKNNEIAKNEKLSAEERYAALNALNKAGVISDKEASDAKIAIAQAEKNAKIVELDAYASVLNQSSALLGKNTVEGKAVAIAAATISTYTAIAKTLGAFAGVPIPGYAIAQAIVTGIAGFAAVKNIIDTPIPNQGGGGGGGTPSMPSMPAAPAMRPTGFSTGQPSQTPPKVEPQKVYVVESDITNSQNKVARIQSKATIQ
jgi:hypothetical protein